jgi:hypothetical protein
MQYRTKPSEVSKRDSLEIVLSTATTKTLERWIWSVSFCRAIFLEALRTSSRETSLSLSLSLSLSISHTNTHSLSPLFTYLFSHFKYISIFSYLFLLFLTSSHFFHLSLLTTSHFFSFISFLPLYSPSSSLSLSHPYFCLSEERKYTADEVKMKKRSNFNLVIF